MLADDSGDPLTNARVSVTPAVGLTPVVLTDGDGRFAFSSLPPARYTISATKAGYVRGQLSPTAAGQDLGSSAADVFHLVLREGLVLIASGCAIGAVGVAALSRRLESQLFGVHAGDPAVVSLAAATLALVALVACTLPARRATRINPVIALDE